ncbi:MAG: hypothetical protein FVQ80_01665 [Planctomycetes bacterium]|nr:hypothetical protein [Planctomycetota bacterium]
MKKNSIVVICAVLLIGSIATADLIWESEVIFSEPGEPSMWEASLALDQDDNPHVSYRLYYVDNGGVQYDKMLYSYKDSQGWVSSIFDFDGGAYESLAIDSQGFAHISYYDTPGEDLAYTYWDGTGWQKETVDKYDYYGSVGGFTSLVLDGNDNPHISYMDWTGSYRIKYAHDDGTGWEIQEFPGWFGRTDMTLDDSGNPHIVAGGQYGYWNGSSWQISTFQSGGGIGEVSIKLDSAGNPHIAYYGDGIKYAYWNGSSWEIQTVGHVFSMISLELDSNDIPHIMYGTCNYATLVEGNWVTKSLASGHFEDFALDSYDRVHFVYTPHYESLVYMHQVPEPTIGVAVDIKPGSCPNPLNVKSKGVLPIAILGSAEVDVTTIDVATILLEGVVIPIRSSYEDVATVFDSNDCNCATRGPDGFLDLTLKFDIRDIADVIGDVSHRDELSLTLEGALFEEFGGTLIQGADCITIRVPRKAR